MPGVIIAGREHELPGLTIHNWRDAPDLRRGVEDGQQRRARWIQSIVCHTTRGIPGGDDQRPQTIRPGAGRNLSAALAVAKFWRRDQRRRSGAHLVIDTDGSVGCLADLATEEMFHAGSRGVNSRSIGIECYQFADGSIYERTLEACVALCDALCQHFGIQRQFHWPYRNGPFARLSRGGADCAGVFGHRDVSDLRGAGDPGDHLFERLRAAGFESFDFEAGEDLRVWKQRQRSLGLQADGIPGQQTCQALRQAGHPHGLWTLARRDPG
jgi:hypothetical protein